MFTFSKEFCFSFEVPIECVWDFGCSPGNWAHFQSKIKSFQYNLPLQTGSKIRCFIDGDRFLNLHIDDMQHCERFEYTIKTLLINQKTEILLKATSKEATHIQCRIFIKNLLVPILRKYFERSLDQQIETNLKKFSEELTHFHQKREYCDLSHA